VVISLKTKFAQCQPAVGQKCSTYRVSILFPLPASELCKYLCKQMRANQINQIQCTLTTSQWSPSRQTPPFHSLPSHSIASSSKSHWEMQYTRMARENARHLGNQWKLELAMVAAMWLQFH